MKIDFVIEKILHDEEAQNYAIETKSVTSSFDLKLNQFFIVEKVIGTAYTYQSADEYTNQFEYGRLTINRGFVDILAGSPTLIGTLITITKYKQEQEQEKQEDNLKLALITDTENNIKKVKIV